MTMRDLEEEDVMQIADELFEDLLQDAVQDMASPGNTTCGACVWTDCRIAALCQKSPCEANALF